MKFWDFEYSVIFSFFSVEYLPFGRGRSVHLSNQAGGRERETKHWFVLIFLRYKCNVHRSTSCFIPLIGRFIRNHHPSLAVAREFPGKVLYFNHWTRKSFHSAGAVPKQQQQTASLYFRPFPSEAKKPRSPTPPPVQVNGRFPAGGGGRSARAPVPFLLPTSARAYWSCQAVVARPPQDQSQDGLSAAGIALLRSSLASLVLRPTLCISVSLTAMTSQESPVGRSCWCCDSGWRALYYAVIVLQDDCSKSVLVAV